MAIAILSAAIAALATVLNASTLSLAPPGLAAKQITQGAAVTHARVQLPAAARPATAIGFETQTKRANLIANVMATPPVLERVSRLIGIDLSSLSAETDLNISVPVAFTEPNNEHRANQLLTGGDPYRLDIQARTEGPLIDVYAQAPSAGQAAALANATVRATNLYLIGLANRQDNPVARPVVLNQLGPVRSGTIDPTAPLEIAALTFLTVFAISFGLLFLSIQVGRGWRRAKLSRGRPGAAASSGSTDPPVRRLDDWPHTTRILPWLIAGFIGLLWLVPINAITVQASLPFDLKLDRLVLPVLVVVWLLSLAAGGDGAPRWRFTRVHAAISLFVAVAFLSVVVNAVGLNHGLELELALKKLTLLAAFFALFLVVASAVRPNEVRPFMTLMLVLASVCAFGVIWEYQFGTDYFYRWSVKFLPGFFHVAPVDTSGFDEIGRPAVIGPADLSLETVAMLSMALPIGFVRLMQATRTRDRVLYGLAICLLLGAMVATYRKSALLAPLFVCLILVYFRRREMIRLAPIGVLVIVALPFLAPNALGSIVDQFKPSHLGVSTVSDRVSDYDAIRPDLLSHPLFGEGYGSYEHTNHRVLDNDLLMRVVETGIVGLAAFVLMIVLVIGAAAPIIRGRDPNAAPVALAVAAAAGAFLLLSALFDVMAFPHTPYLLMVMFGLLATTLAGERRRQRPGPLRAQVPLRLPAPPSAPAEPDAARDLIPV